VTISRIDTNIEREQDCQDDGRARLPAPPYWAADKIQDGGGRRNLIPWVELETSNLARTFIPMVRIIKKPIKIFGLLLYITYFPEYPDITGDYVTRN